jgi:hypothetical protein
MEVLIALPILFFSLMLVRLYLNKDKKKDPADVLAFNLTHEEYYKTLNFMLMYSVITPQQYTEFMSKGSPYLG